MSIPWRSIACTTLALGALATPARADLTPGNLLLSRSVYDSNSPVGAYPFVFNNEAADPSFGVTSPIFLDEMTPAGTPLGTIEVPNSLQAGVPPTKDQLVTSFPSKSELALNLSTGGKYVTFMGYVAPVDATDVSNSNTPSVFDPTNPVPFADYRAVAELDGHGKLHFTETSAYSGNNGRAAIENDAAGLIYTAGNAGNGGNPQPDGVIAGAGAQIMTRQERAEAAQRPGAPAPVGSFSISQLGFAPDKVGKDTNFRGLTIHDGVVYTTKGSGGNGVNTVYFIDTTGTACPHGVGLPVPGAPLPTDPIAYDSSTLQTDGVTPYNMCVLAGFPTALKSKTSFPFGVWFAGDDTLYVADEGNGDDTYSVASGTYTKAAAQSTAGLQKWTFDATSHTWKLAYTLKAGLGLGQPYTVDGYPAGDNEATGLPWSPATDGLRNITGRVNDDGTATIWGITSTVSGGGDQGADPNRLVTVTDDPASAAPAAGEAFSTVRQAGFAEVLRGVSFTPGTR